MEELERIARESVLMVGTESHLLKSETGHLSLRQADRLARKGRFEGGLDLLDGCAEEYLSVVERAVLVAYVVFPAAADGLSTYLISPAPESLQQFHKGKQGKKVVHIAPELRSRLSCWLHGGGDVHAAASVFKRILLDSGDRKYLEIEGLSVQTDTILAQYPKTVTSTRPALTLLYTHSGRLKGHFMLPDAIYLERGHGPTFDEGTQSGEILKKLRKG